MTTVLLETSSAYVTPPRVSVCIPVYNGEKYIKQTVLSVLAQTEASFELLVLDNASTDNTHSILRDLAQLDKRIRVHRNIRTLDMASNWNVALSLGLATYKMLLSADDLLLPDFLSECLLALDQNPSVDFVSAEHDLIFEEKNKIISRRVHPPIGEQVLKADLVLLKNPFSINFTVWRSRYLEKISLWAPFAAKQPPLIFRSPYITCDYELWMRIAAAQGRMIFLDRILAQYRVHSNSLSSNHLKMLRHTAAVALLNREHLLQNCPWAYRFTLLRFWLLLYRLKFKTGAFSRRLACLLWRRIWQI